VNGRLFAKLTVIVLTAGLAVTLFCCSGVERSVSLDGGEVAGMMNSDIWECTNHEALSRSTVRFTMKYAKRHPVGFLLGLKSGSSQSYPQAWIDFPGLKPAISFRELTSIEGILYKWQVHVSSPDENSARDTVTFTYLIGNKSSYTFAGAGVRKVVKAFFTWRSYPHIILKLYVPTQGNAAAAKEIVDSFRRRVVPRLHRWLEHRYSSRLFEKISVE